MHPKRAGIERLSSLPNVFPQDIRRHNAPEPPGESAENQKFLPRQEQGISLERHRIVIVFDSKVTVIVNVVVGGTLF